LLKYIIDKDLSGLTKNYSLKDQIAYNLSNIIFTNDSEDLKKIIGMRPHITPI